MPTVGNIKETVEITESERRCLEAFKTARKKLAPIPPSVQEVADEMGITKSACGQILKSLENKGKVARDGRRSRTLRPVRK